MLHRGQLHHADNKQEKGIFDSTASPEEMLKKKQSDGRKTWNIKWKKKEMKKGRREIKKHILVDDFHFHYSCFI